MRRALSRSGLAMTLIAWALSIALVLVACTDRSTAADRNRLSEVDRAYASEFELRPWPSIYVEARHLHAGCPSFERAKELYRAFWLDESGAMRTDTSFVYLNLEDEKGKFCFQLAWDPQTRQIEISDQPHY